MPAPDTSNANVAKVLRELLSQIDNLPETAIDYTPAEHEARALADALDAQAATPWEKRVERLARHLESTSVRIHWGEDCEARNRTEYNQRAEAALRIAAPELAPGDD